MIGALMRRAVFFDIGHTLWDWRGGASHLEDIAAIVAGELGGQDHHVALLRRALLQAGYQIAVSYTSGEPREVDFLRLIAHEMTALGEPLNPADAGFVAHRVFELEDRISHMPDYVPDTLVRLRADGFLLGAISNSPIPGSYLRGILRARGLLVHLEHVVSSADFGARKPDPAIFAAACRAVGVDPRRALYVGDRVKEDVRGPQATGMRAVLTREHRQDEPASDLPDAEVDSLRALPELAARLIPPAR